MNLPAQALLNRFAYLATTDGATKIGYDGAMLQALLDDAKAMASYTALRAYAGRANSVRITARGIGGHFVRDPSDTTGLDNGGTIIVDASGRIWKRVFDGYASVKWFGAKGDAVADDTPAFQAAINANLNATILVPDGAYNITSTLHVAYNNGTGKNSTSLLGMGLGSTLLWNGPNNTSMIHYEGTSAFAGAYSKTVIQGLFLKNQVNATGLIGIRLGNFGGSLGMQAGVANVTIQHNKLDGFSIGIQTEYESDGIQIVDNVISEYNSYGVYNTGSARCLISGNYFQFGNPGSIGVYCEYSTITVTDNLIQSSDSGVVGGIKLKDVNGFEVARNYIEFPYLSIQFAILLTNSRSGYIGSNVIQGFQGTDCIYIDGTSAQVNIGPNAFGFFGTAPNSLIRTLSGAADINVLGHQRFDGGTPPSTPILGTGYNFSFDSSYLLLGVGAYTGTPNPGVTAAASGVLNIGNNAAATGWAFMGFSRSGVSIGSITQSGTTAVAYNTSSDYRLKDNVQPMTGALAKLTALKPCTYTWKADGSAGEGFIAHELAAVVPQCVTGEKDATDEQGRPVYQGIDTSFLVATLTAALQEQQAIISQLRADVTELQARASA
jgi:hypothetical protein